MSLRGRTDKASAALGTMQVLVVACGRTYLAIPGAIVRGIVEYADAVQARIVSLFGEACRVTDLAARLGLIVAAPTPDSRIILCGEHRARQAWRVDRVLGLTDVELQRLTPLPPHFAGVEQNWFTGLFLYRETVALTLNPGWLLSQSMDVFVADSLPEGAAAGEALAIDHMAAAVESAASDVVAVGDHATEPSPARKSSRRKRPVTTEGEAASLDILQNLVLEESTDVADNQAPWADT
jgi:hypothetical protein